MASQVRLNGTKQGRKTKVKSGCRTCKIRKIKCDEARPACHRCSSTGRVCEGYGIWDVNRGICRQRQTAIQDACIIPHLPLSPFVITRSEEDKQCFEWFKSRAAKKLPGTFDSELWKTLLFQASLEEPPVLHAVLALSSIHRAGTLKSAISKVYGHTQEDQERFVLKHYVKAIRNLQSHFETKNRASVRVALLACIVFVYLELLRGHFSTAQMHLQKGIDILEEGGLLSKEADGVYRLKTYRESTDDSIIQAFSRLQLQAELLKYTHQHPCLVIHGAVSEEPVLAFNSFNDAWRDLERLLNKVFHLTHLARLQLDDESSKPSVDLLKLQSLVQSELGYWFGTYKTMTKVLPIQNSPSKRMVYELLHIYHIMTVIMCNTCLAPNDTLAFDSCQSQFVLMIQLLANQWLTATKASKTVSPLQTLPGHFIDISKSIIDMAWIPPLYYVAINCRVHRIRLQAIRLLESVAHREGIWDSKTAACVARKVMGLEERHFYHDVDLKEDFPLASSPGSTDLSLPVLPEHHRFQEIEVAMIGSPMTEISLCCTGKRTGINRRCIVSRYDIDTQRWTDLL